MPMKKPIWTVGAIGLFAVCLAGIAFGVALVKRALAPPRTDRTLSSAQAGVLTDAIALMRQRGLPDDATLADQLSQQGKWHAAAPDDPYLAGAERAGDTPYAYTLADGHKIITVVLAPRFFSDTTPAARAALMIHEMGHVRAYLATGTSTEYDGYKREYDAHTKLGLSEQDSLVYFSMLDGITQYVMPRDPSYKNRLDVKDYLAQSAGS